MNSWAGWLLVVGTNHSSSIRKAQNGFPLLAQLFCLVISPMEPTSYDAIVGQEIRHDAGLS